MIDAAITLAVLPASVGAAIALQWGLLKLMLSLMERSAHSTAIVITSSTVN